MSLCFVQRQDSKILSNCNYEIKPQLHNAAYNLRRVCGWLAPYPLKMFRWGVYKITYHVYIKTLLQLLHFPNACEAYSRNIYIPATVELTKNDPTITLHKQFLGSNLTYMNITNYQLLKSWNVTELTLQQHKKLSHKLPNYINCEVWFIERTHPANWWKLSVFYGYLIYNTSHSAGYPHICERFGNLLLL